MGKWSHLVGTLKPEPTTGPWEVKVRALVEDFKSRPLRDNLATYEEQQSLKESLKQDMSDVTAMLEALTRVIDQTLEAQNLERVVSCGRSYSVSPEPIAHVTDKAALRAWAEEHAPDNLSLHHQTLQALVKAALEGDGEMPAGVDCYLRRTLTRRKA